MNANVLDILKALTSAAGACKPLGHVCTHIEFLDPKGVKITVFEKSSNLLIDGYINIICANFQLLALTDYENSLLIKNTLFHSEMSEFWDSKGGKNAYFRKIVLTHCNMFIETSFVPNFTSLTLLDYIMKIRISYIIHIFSYNFRVLNP